MMNNVMPLPFLTLMELQSMSEMQFSTSNHTYNIHQEAHQVVLHNIVNHQHLRDCEIFVKNITISWTICNLCALFEVHGVIVTIKVVYKKNYILCFVRYNNACSAALAIRYINNIINSFTCQKILASLSVDNRKIFIGALPTDKTKQCIEQEFLHNCNLSIKHVDFILYENLHPKYSNRGYGFLEYHSYEEARTVRNFLIENKISLFGKQITVNWAHPENTVDAITMNQVRLLRNILNMIKCVHCAMQFLWYQL
ncbi:hypothetical protein A3Q56_05955 [Intoshia linei]|uniref:RRM domain-containing protein n=1 Tax=Intoshia linei TaxID=1819745 RepID=A0A177AWG7_9BILA|nr:hypothetical protein A3Q56_05955 [Intoshia linei]